MAEKNVLQAGSPKAFTPQQVRRQAENAGAVVSTKIVGSAQGKKAATIASSVELYQQAFQGSGKLIRLYPIFVLSPLFALLGCNELPAPQVTDVAGGVVIEVQRLGEYPSAVTRMRMTRLKDGAVVLELRAPGTEPIEVWELYFERGWNDVRPLRRQFEVVTPRAETVWLEAGEEYYLEIWGAPDWKHRAVRFIVPELTPAEGTTTSPASTVEKTAPRAKTVAGGGDRTLRRTWVKVARLNVDVLSKAGSGDSRTSRVVRQAG